MPAKPARTASRSAAQAPSPAASAKTERLLNLVIALLSTRMPLTKARIKAAVPQYQQTAGTEAFDRMFERDKDELRELGIPLETAVVDPLFDDELGYRIDKREYALPEIAFEPDEVAALALAARAWQRASLAGPAAAAVRKLRSAGVELDDASLVGIEPVVRTTEEAFEPIRRALVDRVVVTFDYRKPDGSTARRRLQPWGLTQWHGHWYVTGFDVERDDVRVFRLSRMSGEVRRVGRPGAFSVPADHDPAVMVADTQGPGERVDRATVRVRAGSGNALRRRAVDPPADASLHAPPDAEGWSVLTVEFTDLERLAEEVAGFGPDVVALAPPALREAVVRRLEQARERHAVAGG